MIAVDTSSFIGFMQDDGGADVDLVARIIADAQLVFPPPVVAELLSDLSLPKVMGDRIASMPLLELLPGFWARVGRLRAALGKKYKARLADTMIAQACIDHSVPLLTRDHDFKRYAKHAGLLLQM